MIAAEKEDMKLLGNVVFVKHPTLRGFLDVYLAEDIKERFDSVRQGVRVKDGKIFFGDIFRSKEKFVSTWEEAANEIGKVLSKDKKEASEEKEKNRSVWEEFESCPMRNTKQDPMRQVIGVIFNPSHFGRRLYAYLAEDVTKSNPHPEPRVSVEVLNGKIVWNDYTNGIEYSADSWEEASGRIRPHLLRVKAEIAEEEEKNRPLLEDLEALPSM